jgi:hypothetical protein
LVAIAIARVAEPDGTAAGSAIRSGIGDDARRGGAASAVVGIVIDVDFAAVVGHPVAVLIALQTSRNGTEAAARAAGVGVSKGAWDARIGRAPGSGVGSGYASVIAELLARGALVILQVVQIDGERTGGKRSKGEPKRKGEANVLERMHVQNSVCMAN